MYLLRVLLAALALKLAASGQAQLFYHLSGSTHGPFSPDQLESWYRGGYFPADMQVSEDPGMSASMPVSQLFSGDGDGHGYSMADYSDDDDMSPFGAGQRFNIGNAREAAQKLANMDVKEYKEKASELATDIRYAAKDSLVKAKEMSSVLGLRVADKISALKQKVKESTGQANPGYNAQQDYYQHQQQNGGGDFQQQQGGYGGPYREHAQDDGYKYQEGGVEQQLRMPQQAPERPQLSDQQSQAAAAVYDAVENAFHHGSDPEGQDQAQPPTITPTGLEVGVHSSDAHTDSSRDAEVGIESDTPQQAAAWAPPEQVTESSAAASLGLSPSTSTSISTSTSANFDADADADADVSIARSSSSGPRADGAEDMTQRDYENVYQPWAVPLGVSAEQQDERYAQRQGEQEQQWYNPYPGQDQHQDPYAAAAEAEAAEQWLGGGEDLLVSPTGYGGSTGGGAGAGYYSDDSDDEYAGILEQGSRGSSSLHKLARTLGRKTKRLIGLGRRRQGRGEGEGGLGVPALSARPSSDFARRAAASSSSSSSATSSTAAPAGGRGAGGETPLSALTKGSQANLQVALTAMRFSPACSLLLLGTLAALPALLIVSASGIPAAVRQLVEFATSSTADMSAATPHDFPGSGLLRTAVKLLEKTPLVAGIPGAHAFIESVFGALAATPTCMLVLLITQRIAVLALAVVPALLSTMEAAVGRDQRRRRDVSRGYTDPLDGALWGMVGKLRFRRLSEAAALVYVPAVIWLMVKLVHQALSRLRVHTAADAPLAMPEFAGPLRVTLASCLIEGAMVLWASLHQHAAAAAAGSGSGSDAGAVTDGVPALASRDTRGAFPSLLLVLMLNSFVRTGQAHESQGGKPWSVLPAARKLLSAEIRRARRLLNESYEEQHGVMQGAHGASPGLRMGGNSAAAEAAAAEAEAEAGLYKPYSHSPVALTRRGMYSLAVFTSTLLATASCLRLLAQHDHLRITVAESQTRAGVQLPLDSVVWLLRRFGKSLFVGLSDPAVSPIAAGFNYNADRGLYLGVNILLAVLSLVPIALWTAFAGAVVRYQHYDDELLSLSAAVKAPIPTSSGGRGTFRGSDEPATTSFRTVISSTTDSDRGVSVAGRVNLHDARAILEAVAQENEYRSM